VGGQDEPVFGSWLMMRDSRGSSGQLRMQALRQPDDGFEQGLFAPLRSDGNQIRSSTWKAWARPGFATRWNPQRVDHSPGLCAETGRGPSPSLERSFIANQVAVTSFADRRMRWAA